MRFDVVFFLCIVAFFPPSFSSWRVGECFGGVYLFLMQIFPGPSFEHSPKPVVLAELRVPGEVSAVPIQPLSPQAPQQRSVPPLPAKPAGQRLELSKTPPNSSLPWMQNAQELMGVGGRAGAGGWVPSPQPCTLCSSLTGREVRHRVGMGKLELLSSFTPRERAWGCL